MLPPNMALALAVGQIEAPPSKTIATYSLEYTNELAATAAFQHSHVAACLSGIVNRHGPRLFTQFTPSDGFWFGEARADGGWLSNATLVPVLPPGNLTALVAAFAGDVKGAVVWDPEVPASSNVASTISGVDDLLPVPYDPTDGSVYSALVGSGLLTAVANLTGKFTGARTGSSKCDAYLYAKEEYLDTGRSSAVLGYYVDYYGASKVPTKPHLGREWGPEATKSRSVPEVSDRLVQGAALGPGQSLVSNNGAYTLTMQLDANLVLYDASRKPLWSSKTVQPPDRDPSALVLGVDGNLQIVAGGGAGANGTVLWQTGTKGTGGKFWLWVQHDGNVVLYEGVCCEGKPLWASNTARTLSECSGGGRLGSARAKANHRAGRIIERPGAFPSRLPDTSGQNALTQVTNHDYFVSRRAFFFDLSVWADEAPVDDPHQPLGTDRSTLLALFSSAYARSRGTEMIHMGYGLFVLFVQHRARQLQRPFFNCGDG